MSLYDSNRNRPHTPVMELPTFAKKFYDGEGKGLQPAEFREVFTRKLMAFMTESYINANLRYFKDEETRKAVREEMSTVFGRLSVEMKLVVNLVTAGKPADYFKLWEAFDSSVSIHIGMRYANNSSSSPYRSSVSRYAPWR